jgi:hypothetical protein
MRKIEKGVHLVGHSKTSQIGITYSSKPEGDYGEKIIIEESDKSVAFVQKFDNFPLNTSIKNPNLLDIAKTRIPSDVLKAHLIYKFSDKNMIIMNTKLNQI